MPGFMRAPRFGNAGCFNCRETGRSRGWRFLFPNEWIFIVLPANISECGTPKLHSKFSLPQDRNCVTLEDEIQSPNCEMEEFNPILSEKPSAALTPKLLPTLPSRLQLRHQNKTFLFLPVENKHFPEGSDCFPYIASSLNVVPMPLRISILISSFPGKHLRSPFHA